MIHKYEVLIVLVILTLAIVGFIALTLLPLQLYRHLRGIFTRGFVGKRFGRMIGVSKILILLLSAAVLFTFEITFLEYMVYCTYIKYCRYIPINGLVHLALFGYGYLIFEVVAFLLTRTWGKNAAVGTIQYPITCMQEKSD